MASAHLAIAACALLVVAGCSDRAVDVQVPTAHPANPDAAAAPTPEPSTTLAIHPGAPGEGVLFPQPPPPGQIPDAADGHATQGHRDAGPASKDAAALPAGAGK